MIIITGNILANKKLWTIHFKQRMIVIFNDINQYRKVHVKNARTRMGIQMNQSHVHFSILVKILKNYSTNDEVKETSWQTKQHRRVAFSHLKIRNFSKIKI